MPVEPLNLSLARRDAAQQVQNLFAQADRAGRAAAGKEGQEAGTRDAMAVHGPDAAQGARIGDGEAGSSGAYEGTPEKPKSAAEDEQATESADPQGRGRKLDITA